MNKNSIIQNVSIAVIVVAVLICGYVLLVPKNQDGNQNQNPGQSQNTTGVAPVVDGKQVIKMTVYGSSYSPNYFKLKAGIPVQWEITSSGQTGCDSGALIANGLIQGISYLNPGAGQTTTVNFTPKSAGFSCAMGMVKGTIEVVN